MSTISKITNALAGDPAAVLPPAIRARLIRGALADALILGACFTGWALGVLALEAVA